MRYFYLVIMGIIIVLGAIVIQDYTQQRVVNNAITKITKQYYYAVESNYLEPTQESLNLSKKFNDKYPQMKQINRLDFIYE